jgi:hypothetical protein
VRIQRNASKGLFHYKSADIRLGMNVRESCDLARIIQLRLITGQFVTLSG